MFDFAWSEILLIGAVALIAIGPKDMPAAIRTVTRMIKKARRMAAEFQTHVDEMVREAELGEVKKTFRDIRNFDLQGAMERAVDPDRSIRNTFADNPVSPTYPSAAEVSTLDEVAVAERPELGPAPLAEVTLPPFEPAEPAPAAKHEAPAFIPPNFVPASAAGPVRPAEPPAFIPPNAVRH